MSDCRNRNLVSKHLDWVDGTRTVAALAVVLLHTAASAVTDSSLIGSGGWWFANVLDSSVRWCVPVFVMLSGALLLAPAQPGESWQDFYRRRFARLLLPLLFWSIFYLIYDAVSGALLGRAWRAETVLLQIAQGKPYFHLWYLFMLPGLYLVTPLLRQLLAILSRQQLLWLCAAILGLACANRLFSITHPEEPVFAGILFLPYLGYFLVGYLYISHPRASTWPWPVFLLSCFITAWGCGWMAGQGRLSDGLYFYDRFSISVIPMSLAVFALCMRLPVQQLFRRIAPLSFGIYLLHPLWLDIFWQLGARPNTYHPVVMIPALTLVACLCSAACTALFFKIPVLRRTV